MSSVEPQAKLSVSPIAARLQQECERDLLGMSGETGAEVSEEERKRRRVETEEASEEERKRRREEKKRRDEENPLEAVAWLTTEDKERFHKEMEEKGIETGSEEWRRRAKQFVDDLFEEASEDRPERSRDEAQGAETRRPIARDVNMRLAAITHTDLGAVAVLMQGPRPKDTFVRIPRSRGTRMWVRSTSTTAFSSQNPRMMQP